MYFELCPPADARVLDAGMVVEKLSLPVRRHAECVQMEGHRRRVDSGREVARGDRSLDVDAQHGQPFAHHGCDCVSDRAGTAVHLA
jgi:hypothetical protein